MDGKVKTILWSAGVLAVAGVGFMMYKRMANRKKFTMPPLDDYTAPPPSGLGSGSSGSNGSSDEPTSPVWTPAAAAQNIYDSMKGAGTDEDLFFNTAEPLSSSQRTAVKNYFNENLGEGDTLCEWIEADFSMGDEDKALALFGYPTGAWYSNC